MIVVRDAILTLPARDMINTWQIVRENPTLCSRPAIHRMEASYHIRLYGISVFILKLLEIKLGSPLEGMFHVLFSFVWKNSNLILRGVKNI